MEWPCLVSSYPVSGCSWVRLASCEFVCVQQEKNRLAVKGRATSGRQGQLCFPFLQVTESLHI